MKETKVVSLPKASELNFAKRSYLANVTETNEMDVSSRMDGPVFAGREGLSLVGFLTNKLLGHLQPEDVVETLILSQL